MTPGEIPGFFLFSLGVNLENATTNITTISNTRAVFYWSHSYHFYRELLGLHRV